MFSRNISTQYSYRKCLFIQCTLTNYLKQIKCSCNITSVGSSRTYKWNTVCRPTRAFCTNNNSIIGVKGVFDGDKVDVGNISHLLESPRQTLHNMQSKAPNKIFDVHYKHNIVNHQGPKKKIQNKDWTCIYSFVWPEKMKFESTALSKHQAATNAATLALKWLYKMRRIDKRGSPVHDETVLAEARSKSNDKIHATISDNSATRIERIWGDYENEIKSIYERTFKEAAQRLVLPPVTISKDSTIDDEDECEDGSIITEENFAHNSERLIGEKMKPPSQSTLAKRNEMLRKKFEQYDEELTPLPIDQYVDQLATTVQNSRVTILVGAPGCGKSTRAPTAILRRIGANTTVIVSEPRKVAAIGLARRVASELSENVGESVGYQVRLDSKPPRQPCGTILYCTSGVLLKRLQLNPGLEDCSHVIIDEAHERDVNTDITLLLLKKALDINPNLKVMVMSATLDIGVFTRYFDSCPIVEVPGKTFPVQVSYLNEIQKKFQIKLPNTLANCSKEYGKPSVYCEEIVELIKAVDKQGDEGAILVFLPGWAEIKQTKQLLDEYYRGGGLHLILPVHSRLSTTEQTKIFDRAMPGVRKIVLATNIAETSITIPDVTHVIDSGAHKENRMKDGTGVATLECVWVSQAGAKQRTGRAGRVQPGHCYKMYTNEKANEFAPHTTPEILRIPLVQTALDCKSYAPEDKIESFLSQLPEPPTSKAIQFAVNDLKDLGALTREEQLTRVGVLLSRFSLHPRVARGVLHAAVCGSLRSLAVTAAHCSAPAELFARAFDRRDEIRELKKQFNKTSDHSALYLIQCEFERALAENGWRDVDQWCDKYGLRKDRLGFIKSLTKLYLEETLRSGVVHSATEAEELTRFSEIDEMSSAIFFSGSNCLLTTKRHVETKGKLKTVNKLFTSEGDKAHIGTESVNYGITKQTNKTNLLVYFDGYHSTDRRALIVYKTSLVTPQAVLLFSKGNIYRSDMDDDNETTILNLPRHRLKVHVSSSQADVILKAKEMIWNTFEYYIERDSRNIDYDEVALVSRFKIRLFKAVAKILMEAHMEYIEDKNVQNYDAIEDEE